MPKKTPIYADIADVRKLLKLMPPENHKIANNLFKRIKFLSETLDKLQAVVERDGTVEDFKQGKQEFTRESPALKSYNNTLKSYLAAYKQLVDLKPKQQAPTPTDDGFENFVDGREEI